MGEHLIITGKSKDQIYRMVAAGNAFRLCQGVHLRTRPTPNETYDIVQHKWPDARLTGRSVHELFEEQPLTFPLDLATTGSVPRSELWIVRRKRRLPCVFYAGRLITHPLIAAGDVGGAEGLGIIERRYEGRAGKEKLDKDLTLIQRLSPRSRELLNRAAIGSDSWAEQRVVRRIRAQGLKVETNHLIGVYRWDIVIPALKVAVEIDGFEFHGDLITFIKDHWKRNDAALRGWLALGYTGSCVKHNLDDVVEQILNARAPDTGHRCHTLLSTWHQRVINAGYKQPPFNAYPGQYS